MTKKIKQSETITVKRSQINFAAYNPKHHTKEQIQQIVKNFKKVGFLGGIIWNERTANLVDGHKRMQAMDIINKYDGSAGKDYDVKVERTDLDEKTEKEQNVFQSSSRTDFDDELMRMLIPEIDYEAAGLNDDDLAFLGIDFNVETGNDVINEVEEFYEPVKQQKQIEKELTAAEKKENVQNVKKDIQEKAIEKVQNMDAYVTLSFDNWKNKEAFMKRFGFDTELKMIKGERLSEMVERID